MKLTQGKKTAELTAEGVRLEYDGDTTSFLKWTDAGGTVDEEAREAAAAAATTAGQAYELADTALNTAQSKVENNPVIVAESGFMVQNVHGMALLGDRGSANVVSLDADAGARRAEISIDGVENKAALSLTAGDKREQAGREHKTAVSLSIDKSVPSQENATLEMSASDYDGGNVRFSDDLKIILEPTQERFAVEARYMMLKTSNPDEYARYRETVIDFKEQQILMSRGEETRIIDLWTLGAN